MFAHRWRLINKRLENKPSSLFLILFESEEGILFYKGEAWKYFIICGIPGCVSRRSYNI